MEKGQRRLALYALAAVVLLDALQGHAVAAGEGLYHQDFFGIWSFARFARGHAAAAIYQPTLLNQYQAALSPGFHGFFPFPYPPDFLLLLWPLGGLPYGVARLLWTGLSAALFGWTVWRALPAQKPWRLYGVMLALLAPASLNEALTGETGYFTSALLLGGFLLLPWRPILAGGCFGLLSCKPQLAVLLPFALLGLGAWRAGLAALAMAAGLAALSCLAFPLSIWGVWLQALHHYQGLVGQNAGHLAPLMTTLTATAESFGLSGGWLLAVQIAGLAAASGLCLRLFRRGDYDLAVAALLAGTFAVTPHAFFYDAPVVTVSLLLLLVRTRGAVPDLLLAAAVLLLPLFAGGALIVHNMASLLYAGLCLRLAKLGLGEMK